MAPVRRNSKCRKLSETEPIVVAIHDEEQPNDKCEKKNASNDICTVITKSEDANALQQISKPRTRSVSEKHLIKILEQEQNENDCPTQPSERRDEEIVIIEPDKSSDECHEKDHFRTTSNGTITVLDIDMEEELLNKEVSETFSRVVNSEGEEEMENCSSSSKRGRGRPRKQTVSDKPVRKSDTSTSDTKLRRRDQIRVTERYSPEGPQSVTESNKKQRKSITFPSTIASSVRYLGSENSEEDENVVSIQPALLHTKKMLLKRSENDKQLVVDEQDEDSSSQVFIVDMKKDFQEGKVLLTLADGASYCIETKKRLHDEEEEEDEDFYVEEDDPRDKDYKGSSSSSSKRRVVSKIQVSKQCPVQVAVVDNVNDLKPGSCQATGIKLPKMVRKATKPTFSSPSIISNHNGNSNLHHHQIQMEDSCTTKIMTPGGPMGKRTVTYITTPKSVTLTPANTYSRLNSSKRNYSMSAKFLNEISDLSECSLEEISSDLELLPDRILLFNSELPLEHSTNVNLDEQRFLFTQVISPMSKELACVLCNGSSTYKEERQLIDHYEHFHELSVQTEAAKFSEDIVFVCLPQQIIAQLNDSDSQSGSDSVLLNAPCQYCGDDVSLKTMDEMKNHYSYAHSKDIRLVEQEKILDMHRKLRCNLCSVENITFKQHHAHMKEMHKLHTLVCRNCVFTTQDPHRLVTHFKARHLIATRSQNMQCNFCNGICIGAERMNKHLITAHCVQTGPDEYSCTVCLQPHGSGDQLLQHSISCPGREQRLTEEITTADRLDECGRLMLTKPPVIAHNCFLCDRKFDSSDKLDLHLHHVHARWANRLVLNDTFSKVQQTDGQTDLKPKSDESTCNAIALGSLPSNKQLEEIGAKTQFGYYCHKCECVIRIYQLFYLHMHNLHKQSKHFECRITSCKQTFSNANEFQSHVETSGHPQHSVIERPLESIACHICDVYFLNEQQMEEHNLSEEHHLKLNQSIEKSTVKTTEARNFKCKTCHTWFGLMDSFVFHMENESHKHGCPHCGLHFALPSSRRTHIQSVHSDRADICELCNQRQGTKERLFAHLVSHSLVFECDKCMRKFYQREQLNNHMETHGPPVDCPWPTCGKRINRASLSTHYRAHKMESQLRCKKCDKLFSNKQQLITHQDVHLVAEQKAKTIMTNTHQQTSLPNRKQVASTIHSHQTRAFVPTFTQPKQHSVQQVHSQSSRQSMATTLISITTPSSSSTTQQQQIGQQNSGLISNKSQQQLLSTGGVRTYSQIKSPCKSKNEKMEKIACCTCNETFSSPNKLSTHNCPVPVVTITGPKEMGTVILTDENKTESPSKACTEEEADKIILDLVDQMKTQQKSKTNRKPTTVVVPTLPKTSPQPSRFMESNKKTYDLQNRVKRTYSSTNRNRSNRSQPKKQQHQSVQQHFLIETPGQPPQLILADPEQLQAILMGQQLSQVEQVDEQQETQHQPEQPIQKDSQEERQQQEDEVQFIQQIQPASMQENIIRQAFTEETSVVAEPVEVQTAEQLAEQLAEQAALEGGQLIMIQHPDGQCLQICVPDGMDVDEVLKSLQQNWQIDQTVNEPNDQLTVEPPSQSSESTFNPEQHEQQSLTTHLDSNQPSDPSLVEPMQIVDNESSIVLSPENQQHQQQQELIDSQIIQPLLEESYNTNQTTFDANQLNSDQLQSLAIDQVAQPIEIDGLPLTSEQETQFMQIPQQHQQTITLDASVLLNNGGHIGEGEDGQQLIYLPINEDGTCSIDAASLAMLTNGEMPIIVSSSSN